MLVINTHQLITCEGIHKYNCPKYLLLLVQIKHTGQHFTPVVLQFPAQTSASCKAIQHINCEGIHKSSSSKSLLLMVKIKNIWVMWILLFPGKTNASCQLTSTLLVKAIYKTSASIYWYKFMWMLLFPAQVSASCQSSPAHYLWRDTQIQLSKISPICTNYEHAIQHFRQ